MKKTVTILLVLLLAVTGTACGKGAELKPQTSQMKAIFELATMDCYYHNVAKYLKEDASGMLWWEKDRHFWVEYSGVVRLGVDVSRVNIEVNDQQVTITMPPAEIQSCWVDPDSLTKDSYIVDGDSAKITAEDEREAFEKAQKDMEETARSDKALLASAQQRAQILLEDYVKNVGQAAGKEYTVEWVYLDEEETDAAESTASSQA